MIGFGIDKIQADYVAEIKLRHLNREYILKKTEDIEKLRAEIEDMEDIFASRSRVKKIIVNELSDVVKNYDKPRRSEIIYTSDIDDESEPDEEIPNYPVTLFFTKEGYFKKITPQSLRMSGEQKLKENDEIIETVEAANNTELLFFTDKCRVYKAKAAILMTARRAFSAIMWLQSLRWSPMKTPCIWRLQQTIRALCCSSLKTASLPK